MNRKKQQFYVPVTMDELMARFVVNMKRNEAKEQLESSCGLLMKKTLSKVQNEAIVDSVQKSMSAFRDLLNTKVVTDSRQSNGENKVYLQCLEKSTKKNNLEVIGCQGQTVCEIIRMKKPAHLKQVIEQ